jgi:predicted RND superfamily exporter protein
MTQPSRFLGTYARWIVSHRLLVILAVLIFTGLLLSRAGNLRMDFSPDVYSPQAHPYVQATHVIENVFGGRNITVIGVVPRQGDIYQPAVLAKIQHIQAAVEQLPNVIRHNVLSLGARKVKDIRGNADGMEVRQMMESIPQTPEEIARLKAAVASMPIYINSLVSPDGRAAAVIADFKIDEKNPSAQAMVAALRPILDRERDSSVDFYLGGLQVNSAAAEVQMMKMPLYFGLATLIIMIVQYWSFRSLQGMLLPMLTGLVSVLWSLGCMGILGIHLDPLCITTPILILAVATGHAIQILKRYYEEYRRLHKAGMSPQEANREAVVESIARVGPVMITAGLIATITFYSLGATGIDMVKHFGVFAGSGVLGTMILEMTLIPSLRAWLPAPKVRESDREGQAGILDRFLSRLASLLVGGRAPWFVGGGVLFLALAASGMLFLHVDNNFKLYFKPDSEFRVHDRVLNQRFGGTNAIQFLIETPQQDGIKDPRVLKAMDKLQAFFATEHDVGKTQSLADLVKRMNQAMHGDNPAAYAIPQSRELVAQYLFLYSLSGDPQDFDSFVDNDYQRAVIWAYIKNDSTAYADALARKAQAVIAANFPPDVKVRMGGSQPQIMALNEVLLRDKLRNMAQMGVIVFVLSALVLRSFTGGIFVLTPLLAVITTNFGLLGWLGMPLDLSAVVTAAMAIGIGADYEIYLLFRFKEELARHGNVLQATLASLLTSGKAILFVAISIAGGYAVLQTAAFTYFNMLSSLVTATMLVSALFALFFLRALMMVFKPRFIFGERRRELFAEALATVQGGAK